MSKDADATETGTTETGTTETGTAETIRPAKRSGPWLRLLPLIFFAIIAYVVLMLFYIMAVVQFVVVIVNRGPNDQLRTFGHCLTAYLQEILDYLIYRTDQMPFPFAVFPGAEAKKAGQNNEDEAAPIERA